MEALFKAQKDRLREESYRDEAVQSIRANIRWLASNGAAVCAWLKTPAPAAMRVPGLPGAALAPAPAAAMAPTGMSPGPSVDLYRDRHHMCFEGCNQHKHPLQRDSIEL